MTHVRLLRPLFPTFATLLLAASLVGCDDSSPTTTTPDPTVAPCTAGTLACECLSDGSCSGELICASGLCVEEPCSEGTEGCPCFGNGTCLGGLRCDEALCITDTCPDGTEGCACGAGNSCNSGLTCASGTCTPVVECPAGTEGCPCFTNATCYPDLTCSGGTCAPVVCEEGTQGCPCFGNGTCTVGLECTTGTSDGVCQPPPECPSGTQGCPCANGNSCAPGLACQADVCVTAGCTAGTYGCVCAAGDCIGDLVCVDGTCDTLPCTAGTLGCACDAGACGDGLFCDQGLCATLGCTLGDLGCLCTPDKGCNGAGLICNAGGFCQPSPCPAGTEGCPCGSGEVCGLSPKGEPLTCDTASGLCVSDCDPGTSGCACALGADCYDPSDGCTNGYCMVPDCAPGTLGCSCGSGACLPGLACIGGSICVDNTGFLGGACYGDGSCAYGFSCELGACQVCPPGQMGCDCVEGTCAGTLECVAGTCDEVIAGPTPPADQPCYTPCQGNLTAPDGTVVICDADRLLPGCFDGLECVDGSCVTPGTTPPGCTVETDCADFQTCIAGGCYSTCIADVDCQTEAGELCHKKVCRQACSAEDSTTPCPAGFACETEDGVAGACTPVVPVAEGAQPQTVVYADFTVDTPAIALTNAASEHQVLIRNDSPATETFIVRKRTHTKYLDNGDLEVASDPWNDGVACDPLIDCPLTWLDMGPIGTVSKVQDFEVTLTAGDEAAIDIAFDGSSNVTRWDGRIDVVHPTLGVKSITLTYSERPDGRWNGNVYYFASFGDVGLADWVQDKTSTAKIQAVGNALVQRWAAFRLGNIGWENFQAVLKSTQTESWRWATVKKDCPAAGGACYPFTNNQLGLVTYTSNQTSVPVPSGLVELPLSMNLHASNPDEPGLMSGRIESQMTLQYAGNPAVTLNFEGDPSQCDLTVGGACLALLNGMNAEIYIGGRYTTDAADTDCAQRSGDGYALIQIPWLVPGFERATFLDETTGSRYRYECRDSLLPFANGGEALTDAQVADNVSLSVSNPIPDARTRRRTLTLIDGALVNQNQLFILFREDYDSFLPDDVEPFSAYGYMLLEREEATLDPADDNGNDTPDVYEGSVPEDNRSEPDDVLAISCSPELVNAATGGTSVTASNAAQLVDALITGRDTSVPPQIIGAGSNEIVHYLCADTGLIDGGPGAKTGIFQVITNTNTCGFASAGDNFYDNNGSCDDGGPDSDTSICDIGTDVTDCGPRKASDGDLREPCPVGSDVTFFTLESTFTQANVAALGCQASGTCQEQLNAWLQDGTVVQLDPVWRCQDSNAVFCDDDRFDLRSDKEFFSKTDPGTVFPEIYAETDMAFRYKTRFVNRTDGSTPGFVPQICIPNSNQIPYCYDPKAIEGLRERVDCLLTLWQDHYDAIVASSQASANRLDDFLCSNFAYAEACHQSLAGAPVTHDGFERLYAELLVMLGDDAYTAAFASRFDLVGTNPQSFEGALFETGGINLSGAAGYEMVSLYKATQYYQEVLDRFYAMSPILWESLSYGFGNQNFITPETVVRYFDRLVRASTQKSRAWSEAAKRYQGFNQPELARTVIERAYTATYVESILLSRLMLDIVDVLSPEDRPQVIAVLDEGQRRYRMAMLDMQNVFADISDDITFFGLPPEYIPFPTMDPGSLEQNAFENILVRAKAKLETARSRENMAIERSKAFESDATEFQSELVRLRNTYDNQLADICGDFEGPDGKLYPAISRYAELDPIMKGWGNPCGMAGSGQVFEAMAQYDLVLVEAQKLRTQYQNILEEVAIEQSRVEAQCGLTLDLADYKYQQGKEIRSIKDDIRDLEIVVGALDRAMNVASTLAGLANCSVGFSTSCSQAAIGVAIFGGVAAGINLDAGIAEAFIKEKESAIEKIELKTAYWESASQCTAAQIDGNARMATTLLQLKELDLETTRLQYQIRLEAAQIKALVNRAKRLEDELTETTEMSVNVFAARADPNVRIYRDDAIVNAEVAFDDAIKEAYRATRVLEYYTSQSYAALEQLFLIRLVQFGDYNLENYLIELENAFYDFEETYGLPDTRVAMVSLRDDILRIPQMSLDGTALTQTERVTLMRAALADPERLDDNGYLTIPFPTTIDTLSPLTRNHKILYMMAEIIGSNVGDTIARLYVRQKGTAAVRGLSGDTDYYRFPSLTAVMNPYLNGAKTVFDDAVYKSYRFRDRPFVNTHWELVINQRDEQENQDIDLQSLTDVRLYVYYEDFTALDD